MQAQQQLIQSAKDEAAIKQQQEQAELLNKVNVMDIKVEDDFDIDDIWERFLLFSTKKL